MYFNGEHRFLIEPIENNKMRFIQSEKFTGSMVESSWRMVRYGCQAEF
jgi:hypothetical protein